MPCNTVQMTEVDVSRYQRQILDAALADLHVSVRTDGTLLRNGQVIGRLEGTKILGYGSAAQLQADLPKAYSRRLVIHNAKRAGWKVRETAAGRIQLFK